MTEFICACSASIASVFADALYFPFETMKNRIQASDSHHNFTQQSKAISKLTGIQMQFIISVPYPFVFFYVYEYSKKNLKNNEYITSTFPQHVISAALGEFIANIMRNPLEVVKTQMQVGLDVKIKETFVSIYKCFGFGGFYNGFKATLAREVPFAALQFPIYDAIKNYLLHKNNKTELTVGESLLNGAVAGGIAGFLTTPFDVIRIKLMSQRSHQYKGIIDCAIQTYKDEGIQGNFKAYKIRVLSIAFSGILFFCAYEQVLKVAKKYANE